MFYLSIHTVLAPVQPSFTSSVIQRPTSIAFSWTQPSGGRVDRYTVQYSAHVRGCNISYQGGPTSIGTPRSYTINGLGEDSDVNVTITAINIRGRASAIVATDTTTASRFYHFR